MRFGDSAIDVFFHHDVLTPDNVRAAVYGSGGSFTLVPSVGDILHDFPGYLGKPITVRVTSVTQIGDGCIAYDVLVETVETEDNT